MSKSIFCLIACLFLVFPSHAGKVSPDALVAKTSKRRSKKITRKSKKRSVKRKLASVSYKSITSADLDLKSNNAKLAKKIVKAIGQQFGKAKTIGDWIDNTSHKKAKLQRRLLFSKYLKRKTPSFTTSTFSVVFKDSANKTHMFSLLPTKKQIKIVFDGRNISPKSQESFKKWQKRIWGSSQYASSFFDSLFFNSAAANTNSSRYFTDALTVFSHKSWGAFDIADSLENDSLLFSRNDSNRLIDEAKMMEEEIGLRCQDNGTATLGLNLGNSVNRIEVVQEKLPSSEEYSAYLLNDKGSMVKFGFKAGGGEPVIQAENGNLYRGNIFLLAAKAVGDGTELTSIPGISPDDWGVGQVDLLNRVASVKACDTLKKADITKCDSKIGNIIDFRECTTAVMAEKANSWGYGNKAFKGMSAEEAIRIKIDLLTSYQAPPTVFHSAIFGQSYVGRTWSRQNYRPQQSVILDAAYDSFKSGDNGKSDFHTAVLACLETIKAGNSVDNCQTNDLEDETLSKLRRYASSLTSHDAFSSAESLNREVKDLAREADKACRNGFFNDSTYKAAEDYAKIQQLTSGDQTGLNKINDETLAIVHYADRARAICGNAQMRGLLNGSGKLHQRLNNRDK